MILYPDAYFDNITNISEKFIEEKKIKGLILDVDNTLIDINMNMVNGLENWIKKMKQKGIKFCILSNSNKVNKVKKVAEILDIPYFYFAMKPFKYGFNKAKKILKIENKNIGVIGDQIFTDVIGANRSKMLSILVKPISEKDIWITILKRPIENKIIKKFIKETNNVYK